MAGETLISFTFEFRPRNLKGKKTKYYKSLSHTRSDCKYHIIFIPKKRKNVIYGNFSCEAERS